MKKISTCLWFDGQAEEAAAFYVSCFPRSSIGKTVPYGKAASKASGQTEGSTMMVDFELEGLSFLGLNGGPAFKIDPSISFFVACEDVNEMETLWKKLASTVRMELQEYPWSKRYGWCQDRFGVNWQLMLGKRRQKIAPALLFANERYGKAEEALRFYVSQFPNSKVEAVAKDPATHAVLHASFTLAGTDFVLMEGPLEPTFGFSPAVSFFLPCESQAEIDKMWSQLSADPQAEACGWLRDRYGVSWQVVHADWHRFATDPDPARRERVMQMVMSMKKPDWKALEDAYRGDLLRG